MHYPIVIAFSVTEISFISLSLPMCRFVLFTLGRSKDIWILKPYRVLLLLLFASHFSMARDTLLLHRIQQVAHMAEYGQNEQAEEIADSLLQVLGNGSYRKDYMAQRLHLQLYKGKRYETKEENEAALKLLLATADEAGENKFYAICCKAKIYISLIYEKQNNPSLSREYLDEAQQICTRHGLEELYSTILIRRSLHHRWFAKNIDSAIYYAQKCMEYAQKHNNEFDKTEASLMLGIYAGKKGNNKEGIPHFLNAAYYYLHTNNYNDAALMFDNVSTHYSRMNMTIEAKQYSDSAFALFGKATLPMHAEILERRYQVFESLSEIDSAYHYLKQFHNVREKLVLAEETANIKRVTEQYQNDKKEQVIKNQRLQLLLVLLALTVIVVATVLIIRRNRKIVVQNKIISRQVEELVRTLEQKQVLLAELQHRVKNNLQHVISILEIQKESVDFNNIDELIRGNQNRIHSMALLYKKLNVSEKVNDLDIGRYITELAELVKDSYTLHGKKIALNVSCSVEKLSIEKALPLGLIIVELISNSMKHAFGKQNIGIILIDLAYDAAGKMVLSYSDNGSGFVFGAPIGKGLGMEIIHGLVEQLDATTTNENNNGFQLSITF